MLNAPKRMNWLSRARRFAACEKAVVTVEWVAIAAGVTIGAIAISFIIMNGLKSPANQIVNQLTP